MMSNTENTKLRKKANECWEIEIVILYKVIRERLTDKIAFEQKSGGSEEAGRVMQADRTASAKTLC